MMNMDWRKVNFALYCFAFLFYGSIITAMGPIIPFFSAQTGKPEPYFSFMFLCRAFGYVAGGSFVKILMEKFTLHQILIGSIFVGGLSFMVSSLSLTFINLALSLFVGASCCCMINITCNVCTMRLFNRDRRPDFWIQILHTVFGVGGLIGPFFVSIFGSRSYFILGIVLAVSSVFFFFLTPPETGPDRKSEIARPINRKAEIAICALYVLYIGQQVGFGSWVSSFVVMEEVADLKQAAYASQIFWVTNTVFRLILLKVTIKVSLRLKYLTIGMVAGSTVNLIAAMIGNQWFAAYVGSFMNGMFLASMFALFLALPLEFGYKLSRKNTANFMMWASLGEGVLGMPIGYAMGLFGARALFWTELLFAITSYFVYQWVTDMFDTETKQTYLVQKKQQIQVSQHLIHI